MTTPPTAAASGSTTTPAPVYTVYRESTGGRCLVSALEAMVDDEELNEHEAMLVLQQFDTSINQLLQTRVDVECHLSGHLSTYRYRDQVWQLILRGLKLQYNDATLQQMITRSTPQQAAQACTHQIHHLWYRYHQILESLTAPSITPHQRKLLLQESHNVQREHHLWTGTLRYIENEIAENQKRFESNNPPTPLPTNISPVLQKHLREGLVGRELNIADRQRIDEESGKYLIDSRGRRVMQSAKVVACELPRRQTAGG